MKKIFVILMLAFLLVSCNQIKKEDILNTEVNEEINPNLDSEITTE